jgi:hypothetical protein
MREGINPRKLTLIFRKGGSQPLDSNSLNMPAQKWTVFFMNMSVQKNQCLGPFMLTYEGVSGLSC